ncbi:FliM/FliN family flagellar motor switch protein [Pelagibius sp. Alg239-R121]|uniref:FliM/FliN family flagellar motor switch protein n=1 Tax=Pelagibius sp. Alg239-R121 TaxID=2993448 RepID=UPI0024A6108D|nr:FliM/FliN family flagellar motor switch protein [Pelagibius sp. Alg239-R121]
MADEDDVAPDADSEEANESAADDTENSGEDAIDDDAVAAEWAASMGDDIAEDDAWDAAGGDASAADLPDVPAIHGVSLEASAILGTALMPVSQLLKMGRGAVVELDKSIGDTIDISINDQMVARGEVMIKEERLCVEITEMVKRISS